MTTTIVLEPLAKPGRILCDYCEERPATVFVVRSQGPFTSLLYACAQHGDAHQLSTTTTASEVRR